MEASLPTRAGTETDRKAGSPPSSPVFATEDAEATILCARTYNGTHLDCTSSHALALLVDAVISAYASLGATKHSEGLHGGSFLVSFNCGGQVGTQDHAGAAVRLALDLLARAKEV
jgi:hypothetical protein